MFFRRSPQLSPEARHARRPAAGAEGPLCLIIIVVVVARARARVAQPREEHDGGLGFRPPVAGGRGRCAAADALLLCAVPPRTNKRVRLWSLDCGAERFQAIVAGARTRGPAIRVSDGLLLSDGRRRDAAARRQRAARDDDLKTAPAARRPRISFVRFTTQRSTADTSARTHPSSPPLTTTTTRARPPRDPLPTQHRAKGWSASRACSPSWRRSCRRMPGCCRPWPRRCRCVDRAGGGGRHLSARRRAARSVGRVQPLDVSASACCSLSHTRPHLTPTPSDTCATPTQHHRSHLEPSSNNSSRQSPPPPSRAPRQQRRRSRRCARTPSR